MRLAKRQALLALLIVPALLLAACSTRGGVRPSGQRDPYLISARELDESPVDNLYDAVRQLRPDWFRRTRAGASSTIMVYLEDRQIGDESVLRSFSVHNVSTVRFLGVTEAQVRYGTRNFGRSAIVVERATP